MRAPCFLHGLKQHYVEPANPVPGPGDRELCLRARPCKVGFRHAKRVVGAGGDWWALLQFHRYSILGFERLIAVGAKASTSRHAFAHALGRFLLAPETFLDPIRQQIVVP
jgi:hypothetical protein